MGMMRSLKRGIAWTSSKWLTSYRINAMRTRAFEMTRRRGDSRLAFIFGCQRSGTTMLSRAIGLSPRVREYGEGDPAYFEWAGAPRLLPTARVESRLASERNCLVLLKPLCESQRAAELLARFPKSKALWIYRDFDGCVRSHVNYYRQFHDGLAYVREMLDLSTPCWKNDNLEPSVKDFLKSASGRALNLESAYALYWLARNSLVHDLPPGQVKVVKYEQILASPNEALRSIFRFLSIPYRSKFSSIITSPPARTGSQPLGVIDDEIAAQCRAMASRLDRLCDSHSASSAARFAMGETTTTPDDAMNISNPGNPS